MKASSQERILFCSLLEKNIGNDWLFLMVMGKETTYKIVQKTESPLWSKTNLVIITKEFEAFWLCSKTIKLQCKSYLW